MEVKEIHQSKILCTIYHHGDLVNRCKIWLGGLASSDAISYLEGTHLDIDNDNSVNESLAVVDDGEQMGFKATMQSLSFVGGAEFREMLSTQKAAEYLWLRATDRLNHL